MWPWPCYISCLCLTILFCKWGYKQHCRVIVVVEEHNGLKCYLPWPTPSLHGFPGGAVGIQIALKLGLFGSAKNLSASARDTEDMGLIPWRKAWQPTSIFLPGKFHGQRSLKAYGTWGHQEWDTTEHWAHTHTHTHMHTASLQWPAVCFPLQPCIQMTIVHLAPEMLAFFYPTNRTESFGTFVLKCSRNVCLENFRHRLLHGKFLLTHWKNVS